MKKIIIILSCLATCLLLLSAGKTIWFYQAGGVPLSEVEKASISNSQVQASQFQAFQYPDYPHYVFSLAEGIQIDQAQELIIFEEKPLFFFKDTNRFSPTMAVGNEEDLDVIGSVYFTPKSQNGNLSETDLLLYYSSIPDLGTAGGHSRKVIEASFYDESGKLVYSEKRADGSKSFYPDATRK